MTLYPPSTIAQLLFEHMPAKSFPALVRELDAALSVRGGLRQISWDNDDVVFVDFNGTRVGLGYFEYPAQGFATCLTIAVGPTPAGTAHAAAARSYDSLCRRLVACADEQLGADEIIWQQTAEPLTCDVVDRLIEMLPPSLSHPAIMQSGMAAWHETRPVAHSLASRYLPPPAGTGHPRTRPTTTTQIPGSFPAAAPDSRHSTPPESTVCSQTDAEQARAVLRRALLADQQYGTHSNAQRATAIAMNTTLAILLPPVGAGLLAASYRYGVNLKHSARAMGATGALLGLAQSAAAADIVAFLPI